jgi:two-component system, OmpR family, sensor histidine kinase BaeS
MSRDASRDRLAIVVHEVRSPVAALAAIAEAYRDAEAPARRRLVSLAIDACSSIERIASDATVASIVRERVDLGRLVEDAATAAGLAGGDIRTEIEPDLPALDADPHRLRQAIDNLISNALTHAAGGAVVVAARAEDGAVVVSVADSGPGIPVDEQARIFEAGVRLDAGRPGSGLGLAVARAIAEAHGGSLAVESMVGTGTTFALRLPVDPS